jgi:hypothetical protein
MDQRSICLFLAIKGLSARDVHNKLVAVLGPDAIASSTVTNYRRQRQFPAISSEASDEPPTSMIDDAILDAFDKQSFSSVRELAKLACIPTSSVYRHLTRSLGFVVKHLRWVLTPRRTLKKLSASLSQINYCSRSAQSNVKGVTLLSPSMSHGSISPRIMSRSGFNQIKNPMNGLSIRFKTRKSW